MKIYSPNKSYTGVSASVSFCNGVGETEDPHLIEWFKEHGYELEKAPKKGKQGKKEEADAAETVLMEA